MTPPIDQNQQLQPRIQFIRLPEVLNIMGIKKTAWYGGIKAKLYPKPTKITGRRASGWDVNDIQALAASRKADSAKL